MRRLKNGEGQETKLMRLKTFISENKKLPWWKKYIIKPNSRFKIIWDLIVIVFSVYNSILIPYEFAYSIETNTAFDVLDRFIDVIFAIDILVNFRTAYVNSKTDKMVIDGKQIALKYILNGRFGIDLIASLPLEAVALLPIGGENNLKFLGMLKMVRLLRLGRMISFLKANQKLKFSIKIGQLLFFLFITIHWINWFWYFVTSRNEDWFPPKDLDFKATSAFTGDAFKKYILFYYYGVLTLVGNELLPSSFSELLTALVMVFVGTIFIGMVIGEFTSLLSNMTK